MTAIAKRKAQKQAARKSPMRLPMKERILDNRRAAVLRRRNPRHRRRHHCRRGRHLQAHALQPLPVQGRAGRSLSEARLLRAAAVRAAADRADRQIFRPARERLFGAGFSRLPFRQCRRGARRRGSRGAQDRHRLQGRPPSLVPRDACERRRARRRCARHPACDAGRRCNFDGDGARTIHRWRAAAASAARVLLANAGVDLGETGTTATAEA